ncbi:MAG: histidine phosphatase family protein [Alphaproteobacteria bacterium]|nr:histidine phosphatase family protein [Alphaproteobacteria bacterium]
MAEIEGTGRLGAPKGIEVVRRLAATPFETPTQVFYFLRHGQTDGNLNRFYQGPETPLNANGRSQAAIAAERLATEPISTILASDMARAWETASTVARHRGVTPRAMPWLRERSFGDLIGSPSHDIDWASEPPGGESPDVFVSRSRTGLAHGISHGDNTLMVSHGGLIYVLSAMLGVRLTDAHFQNGTPLKFERGTDGWACSRVGD